LSTNPHPVTEIAVWFQHRLELMAIDRSLYCHLPTRRKFHVRFLGQAQNSRFVDRVQRGVKTNCCHPCALTHDGHQFLHSHDRDLAADMIDHRIGRPWPSGLWAFTPRLMTGTSELISSDR